jgi:acyl-CoA synthetase (AMP-forming)/AMP-acid ligase II
MNAIKGETKMNIVDMVEKNAYLYPHETAYVEIGPISNTRKEINWLEFHKRTNQLANALLDRGIKPESSIFLLGKNSLNWLECYFGILKTGAWVIPLNFRFTDRDIQFCAQASEPVAFIFDREYADRMEALIPSLDSVKEYICMQETDTTHVTTLEAIMRDGLSEAPKFQIKDQNPCALYFTSGTTGDPKPVLLNHTNLFCTAITESHNSLLQHNDSLLMMPPLYHLAIGHLLGVLIQGGKTVLLTERITPRFILEAMQSDKISYLFLLVPWAIDLLEAFDKKELIKKNYDLASWRFTQMGAQPVPASVVRRLKTYFPDMQFDTTYGLSESAGPGVVHLGIENEHKVGAIGKEGFTWSARIVDSNEQDIGTDRVGELIVKGNGVMTAYYKNPELTEKTIQNGWLHTGDLAKRDRDGFIYLVDRKKDLVISGGENIFPVELEQIIIQHPKVRDVAVIGIPDERLGERVTAVIQIISETTLSEKEINAFCEKKMPRYKRPRSIIFDKVPRSLTGKIEKTKLRKKYC